MSIVVVEALMRLETHSKGDTCEFLPSAADYSGPTSKFTPPIVGTHLYSCSSPGEGGEECLKNSVEHLSGWTWHS